MTSVLRRNLRLLRILAAAWSILLGTAHSLHAVFHLALPAASALAGDSACTLCALDRTPLLPETGAAPLVSVPRPTLLPLPAPLTAAVITPALKREALSPSAGRAPPIF